MTINETFQIAGDWTLVEYITSMDGKPFPPHSPYLCPESKIKFGPIKDGKFNTSQVHFQYNTISIQYQYNFNTLLAVV